MSITIRRAKTIEDCQAVEELVMLCWGRDPLDAVPSHMTMALVKYGGNVMLALDGDKPIGFCLGFDGKAHSGGPWKHHSHMAAVHPDYQDKGIGAKLKLAQRDAILANGLNHITWTFDPLETRNARLNMNKLGGVACTYLRDVYGERFDKLAAGLPTDRFVVDWWIDSSWVQSVVTGKRYKHLKGKGERLIQHLLGQNMGLNSAESKQSNQLYPSQINDDRLGQPALVVQVPKDIQKLKKQDMALAMAWRQHTRELFELAFAHDYTAVELAIGKDRCCYLLSHKWERNPAGVWSPQ